MGDTQDYFDKLRNAAISEMEEILDFLEELKKIYKINSKDVNGIEGLIIDKGLEMVKIKGQIDSLEDACRVLGLGLQELQKSLK
jgi:hypothetical protein